MEGYDVEPINFKVLDVTKIPVIPKKELGSSLYFRGKDSHSNGPNNQLFKYLVESKEEPMIGQIYFFGEDPDVSYGDRINAFISPIKSHSLNDEIAYRIQKVNKRREVISDSTEFNGINLSSILNNSPFFCAELENL